MFRSTLWVDAGFSLMELVVVMAIVAVLAGILVPVVTDRLDEAKVTRSKADMAELAQAFSAYRVDCSSWPANANGAVQTQAVDLLDFTCLFTNTLSKPGWNGPYLNGGVRNSAGTLVCAIAGSEGNPGQGMVDAWGKPFVVHYFANSNSNGPGIVLYSCGPNGTSDSNAGQIHGAAPGGDDICYVVTRKL